MRVHAAVHVGDTAFVEQANGLDHIHAAHRAATRADHLLPEDSRGPARLVLLGVQRFGGVSNYALLIPPRHDLSLADRVLIALQHDPRTSPRHSRRVRDFLDFLIDDALEAWP